MKRKEKITYLEGYYWSKANRDRLQKRIDKGETDPSLHRRKESSDKKMIEIRETIDRIMDGRLRMLLELRYLDNKSLEQVAEEMDLSYSTVTKLHLEALDNVEV